jgi:hypothetical protein
MSFITDLFSGGASKLVDSVGNTLSKVITTKGEKMQLDNEIKKAEMDYQLELQKLSVDEKKAILGDIASARTREESIQESNNATKLGKNITSYLAIGASLLCFGLFYILIFDKEIQLKVDTEKKEIIIYVLGVLSALLTQIYGYYFGSSSGSAAKNNILSNQLNNKS